MCFNFSHFPPKVTFYCIKHLEEIFAHFSFSIVIHSYTV